MKRRHKFLFHRGQLEELIVCLQQIVVEWQSLKDTLDDNELSPSAYKVIAMPLQHEKDSGSK